MAAPSTLPDSPPEENNNPGQLEYEQLIRRTNPDNLAAGNPTDPRGNDTAAGDASDPRGQPAPQSLYEAEQESVKHEKQVGRGYNPNPVTKPQIFRALLSTRRRKSIFGGGIIGVIIGLIFGFSVLQGPFQFIHIAQLLQQFHFVFQQDAADDRFTRIARYIYDPSKPQNTRLGILGNEWADRIETKLNTSGIETAYTKNFGYLDGYIINPEKFQNGMTKDQVKAYFKENYPGLNLTEKDGKLFVSTDGSGLFGGKSRGLIKSMLSESGYSKISGTVQARIMGRRAGVDWHPIKNLDSAIFKTLDAKLTEWRKTRTTDIESGAAAADIQLAEDTSSAGNDKNAQKTAQANAESAQGSAQEAQNEAIAAGEAANDGDPGSIKKFQDSIHLKLTGSAIAAAGVLCLARGLAQDSDNIKQAQVVLPLIRMGMDAITTGNQVMSGNGADLDQMGFYYQLLNGTDSSGKKTSWIEGRSFQAELGEAQTGTEATDTLKKITNGSPFDFLKDGTTGKILSGVCGKVSTGIQLVVGFFGGPISFGVSTLVGLAVGPAVEGQLAHWMAGQAIDPNVTGADYGNYINYGARLAANDQAIASGGRQLSDPEASQLAIFENSQAEETFQDHNVAYKLFNPYDERSAVSKLIDHSSSSATQNISHVAAAMLNIGHAFASLPNIFNGVAHAATPSNYDYGFSEYGFSQAELNNPAVGNPMKNAANAAALLGGPNGQTYMDRATKCFGVNIIKDASGVWDVSGGEDEGSIPKYNEIDNSTCTDSSPDWLSIRFFIFDTQVMESVSCYQGDDSSCSNIGFEPGDNTVGANTQVNPPANGVVDQGTSAQLAQKLLSYQKSGQYKCDNPGDCTDLQKVVQGQSLAGSGGCVAQTLDPKVLQVLLYAIEAGGFKVGTFALCGDHSKDTPRGHSGGFAVDISSVNGVGVNENSAAAKSNALKMDQFLNNLPLALQPDQLISYGYGFHFDKDLAGLQWAQGQPCKSVQACEQFYTLTTEQAHENHIHVGYK